MLPTVAACACADTLLPILTVEEMLLYTAELKQPRSIPLADKQAAVETLLDKLGLVPCRWGAGRLGHVKPERHVNQHAQREQDSMVQDRLPW